MVVLAAVISVFAWYLVRFVTIPIIGSDGGNLLALSRPVLDGDLANVISSQAPLLTTIVYSVLLRTPVPLNLLPIAFALLLVLGTSWFVYKQSGSFLLTSIPVLGFGLSPIFWIQNTSLSPYTPFIFLGYAGLYLSCSYALGRTSVKMGLLGAGLLAASLYTFGQALSFFAIPALCFLVLSPKRETLRRLIPIYGALLALTLPWVIWHLLVGGISHFEDYPLNWFNVKYSEHIGAFWGRDYFDSIPSYLSTVHSVLSQDLLPVWTWLVVTLGFFGVARSHGWRAAAFIGVALVCLSLPVIMRMSPVFARYWYSSLPLLLLLATAGIAYISTWLPRHATLLLFVAAALVSFPMIGDSADATYTRNVTRHEITLADYELFASRIDDSRGIISRDPRIQSLVPGNPLYNNITLDEEDVITYLSWRSDESVSEFFAEHEIGWVILYNNWETWELNFNGWLVEAAGQEPAHYWRIEQSSLVDSVVRGQHLTLYKLEEHSKLGHRGPLGGSAASVKELGLITR